MAEKIYTGYELSRSFFNFSFENPDLIATGHVAVFFFAIEHCNRLGWKSKFGFPTQMVMDAIGINRHQTYIKYFNDLCKWGFFELVQKSQNQYSANIISLKCAMLKNAKALDKALIKHASKQSNSNRQSTVQSIDSIDKQVTINKEPLTREQGATQIIPLNSLKEKNIELLRADEIWHHQVCKSRGCELDYLEKKLNEFILDRSPSNELDKDYDECRRHFQNWLKIEIEKKQHGKPGTLKQNGNHRGSDSIIPENKSFGNFRGS